MVYRTRVLSGSAFVLGLFAINVTPAHADTVTNIAFAYGGGALNPPGDWATQINGASIVSAPTSGNTGTGIVFSNWSGHFNEIDNGVTRTFTFSPIALTSSAEVNSLLNTFYGATSLEASVSFKNNMGATANYGLTGDQTIRDYNSNFYTNDLPGENTNPGLGAVTAKNWWNNGLGQRLDLQTFVLPSSWAGTNLTSMTITDPANSGAVDILSALQVDDVTSPPPPPPTPTPEPSSIGLFGTGLLAITGLIRRRMRPSSN